MFYDFKISGSVCIYNKPILRPQQKSLLPGENGIINRGAVTLILISTGLALNLTKLLYCSLFILLIDCYSTKLLQTIDEFRIEDNYASFYI
jgi:hypothetical protein